MNKILEPIMLILVGFIFIIAFVILSDLGQKYNMIYLPGIPFFILSLIGLIFKRTIGFEGYNTIRYYEGKEAINASIMQFLIGIAVIILGTWI